MADDVPSAGEAGLSPSAAFSLLGHEHRVTILEALLELHRTRGEYPASFSTLREVAGIDVSAQFSYHLGELAGHYVRKTDDGYAFRVPGWEVATGILAGTYDRGGPIEDLAIDGTCPLCHSADLAASYLDGWLSVECRACESELTRYTLAPGAIRGREPAEYLRVFDRRVRTDVRLARDGICPSCAGPMEAVVGSHDGEEAAGRTAAYRCRRCGNRIYPPVGAFLLETPVVREFYRKQDAGVESRPHWEFRLCVDGSLVEVREEDPWRCRVRVPGDDALVVELDEELAITSTSLASG